jgi:predicted transcriptional regulator
MTSNVVPADDDLVYALTNIARGLKYGPDQAWIEEAIETIASLSSELARCRNALDFYGREWREDVTSTMVPSEALCKDRGQTARAALNPIGEEGAREP